MDSQYVPKSPQPVVNCPQPVPRSPRPVAKSQPVVAFSIPSHDLKKYQVPDDDRLPPVATVTAVAVSDKQSEYSMFVVPNSKPGNLHYTSVN